MGVKALATASLASLALLLVLPAACAPPRTAMKPTVSLRMKGTPPDATVLVDEEVLGSLDLVAAHGVALFPGVHRITVKATGYFPWDRQVKAELGQGPIQLEVALIPVPD